MAFTVMPRLRQRYREVAHQGFQGRLGASHVSPGLYDACPAACGVRESRRSARRRASDWPGLARSDEESFDCYSNAACHWARVMSMSGWKNSGISGRALLTKYQVRRIGLHAAELPDDVVHPQDVSLNQESVGAGAAGLCQVPLAPDSF